MPEPAIPNGVTRVVLVGFMGCGKTSVGRELAAVLGFSFLDLDTLIEERCGRTIAQIFRESGEAAFRRLERDAALVAMERSNCVIAAGGGAFAQEETRAILRRGSASVYLQCDLETLLARGIANDSRPLAGNRETMAALLKARDPSYRAADVSIDGSRGTPAELAGEIVRALANTGLEQDAAR